MNKTFGGSKDINEIIKDIVNSIIYGTFCFKLISLKLIYAILLIIRIDNETIRSIVNST